MKILLLGANYNEISYFDDRFIKVVTGVGLLNAAINTTIALNENKDVDLVINVGTAGSSTLALSSVHIIGSVTNKDNDLTKFNLKLFYTLNEKGKKVGPLNLSNGPALLSSSSFHTEAVEGFDLYDMEAYAIKLSCDKHKTPCVIIKGVSDIIGESLSLDEYKNNLKNLKSNLIKKVDEVILSFN